MEPGRRQRAFPEPRTFSCSRSRESSPRGNVPRDGLQERERSGAPRGQRRSPSPHSPLIDRALAKLSEPLQSEDRDPVSDRRRARVRQSSCVQSERGRGGGARRREKGCGDLHRPVEWRQQAERRLSLPAARQARLFRRSLYQLEKNAPSSLILTAAERVPGGTVAPIP